MASNSPQKPGLSEIDSVQTEGIEMVSNTVSVTSLIFNALLAFIIVILAVGCRVSPLIPYAVELTVPQPANLSPLPQVLFDSGTVVPGYREFKSTADEQRYLVPLTLTVPADTNRARAIMMESDDGKRAVFYALLAPPPLPLSNGVPRGSALYPVDRMAIRTLTSLQDPSMWRLTISSNPIASQPYALLLCLQIFGKDNIKGFKALVKGESGFLLEARFAINTPNNNRFELGIPISLHHLTIAEQTM